MPSTKNAPRKHKPTTFQDIINNYQNNYKDVSKGIPKDVLKKLSKEELKEKLREKRLKYIDKITKNIYDRYNVLLFPDSKLEDSLEDTTEQNHFHAFQREVLKKFEFYLLEPSKNPLHYANKNNIYPDLYRAATDLSKGIEDTIQRWNDLKMLLKEDAQLEAKQLDKYQENIDKQLEHLKSIPHEINNIDNAKQILCQSAAELDSALNLLDAIYSTMISDLPVAWSDICKIADHLSKRFNISDDSLENYKSSKQKLNDLLIDLYDRTASYRYLLTNQISLENSYILGFISPNLFDPGSILKTLIQRRTDLYRKILTQVKQTEIEILQGKECLFSSPSELKTPILYFHLYDILHAFYISKPTSGINILQCKNIREHVNFMQGITQKTLLTIPTCLPHNGDSFQLFLDQWGITQKSLAKLFGISESNYSREKHSDQMRYRLYKFYLFSRNYCNNLATTQYEHETDAGYKYNAISLGFNQLENMLDAFERYYEHERKISIEKTTPYQDPSSPPEHKALLEHIALIHKNLQNIDLNIFEAMDTLIKASITK